MELPIYIYIHPFSFVQMWGNDGLLVYEKIQRAQFLSQIKHIYKTCKHVHRHTLKKYFEKLRDVRTPQL